MINLDKKILITFIICFVFVLLSFLLYEINGKIVTTTYTEHMLNYKYQKVYDVKDLTLMKSCLYCHNKVKLH